MTLLLALLLMQSPDALAEQGRELAAAGRTEEAAALWRRALTTAPAHFPSLFNLGFLAWQQKQDAAAVQWFERAARAQPNDFNVLFLAGAASSRQGKGTQAIDWWSKALKLQPANGKLRQAMSVEYTRAKRFREAAEVAEAALENEPMYLLAIGARRELGDASALVQQALKKFPGSARVQFEAGYDLHRAGLWQQALPHFDRAIAIDPSYEEPHYYRGDSLLRENEPSRAVGSFLEAIRLRPAYTLARLGLARAYLATAKPAEAAQTLEEAATLDPTNAQPHALLAQVYFRLGQPEKAAAAKATAQRLR